MIPELLPAIRAVRRRWRLRVLMRGLTVVLAGGLIAFVLGAWAVDQFRFSATALLVSRLVTWGVLLGLALQFLARPLLRAITDRQVALYLEEHEPTLDGEVLSATETAGAPDEPSSPALVARVVARAAQHLDGVERGRRVERKALRRSGGMLAGVTGLAVLVVLLSPGTVRTGLPFLLSPLRGGTATPYAIDIEPGDSTIPRGADVRIGAALRNFTAEEVTLLVRSRGTAEWERITMTPDVERSDLGAFLFDVRDTTEYFATAGGVRSRVHRLAVVDLPYVRTINLEYRFPAYTGLEPQRQDDGGDIAALVGTRVRVEVVPTIPAAAGALAVGTDTLPLMATGDGLGGELTVAASGSYRVLLAGPDGRLVSASREYFIDALDDQPPIVRVTQPGRDVSVTSVDELFTEVRAEDDFGLAAVDLVVAVNGGAEQAVALYAGRGGRKDVTAGHTFYLEELTLVPGDVIAYYGRARDARRGTPPAATDIYFVTIRPFDRRWRAADAGGAQGQPDGGASPGELSSRQRDIIAATFRLVRDRGRYTDREWRDNLSTVTLMQGRLREEVGTLIRRIEARGVAELDSTMAVVAEALPRAAAAMAEAEERLGRREPEPALPPEQRALQHLQRAEAAFRERQLARGESGQGGGGAPEASAEELAELFELELDRMRNQYESVERGQRQQTDQQVDEALEKLRELARRQQQENERRRVQAQGQAQGGANSAGQRRLAQEADSLARRLERLSRERQNAELAETARRLQDAADAMRRAAAGREGAAQGESALDRLREARRGLEGSRRAGLERDVRDALRRAEQLVEQQREVQEDVRALATDDGRPERLRRLNDRKQDMAAEVDRLESDLDRLAREARGEQPDAAERLREAGQEARNGRLQDKIQYSRGVMEQRSQEYAERFEEEIGTDLEALRDGIREAAGRIGASRDRELERTLDRTRDVARALESLGARARENAGADSGAGPAGERQLRRELRERASQLRELRQQLQRQGVDVAPLDAIMRQLGRLDNQRGLATPQGLDQLEQAIVQGLKDYEFSLRRQLLGEDPRPAALEAGEAVPLEYRALVEEYYRRLAERRR